MTCRICLSEVELSECVNIFQESRKEELISDLIMNFAFVEVFEEDHLPDVICLVCLKHLHEVYAFKDLIIKSDARLREVQNIASDEDCTNSDYWQETNLNDNNSNHHQPLVQDECPQPVMFSLCENALSNNCKSSTDNSGIKCKGICDKNHESIETKNMKRYKCNQCQSFFKNRYNLILHKTIHSGKFPHSCDICQKGFPTNWAMHVHRRIHFDERPFKCELCDKSFKSKSAQIIHRKIHLGIKSYQCKMCDKQFVQAGGLRAHQYTHTNEKPLVCEFCGKHYSSKRALERHCRIHKGAANQPCPICGKLYAGAINVKIHMKTVHSEDRIRFPCDVCNKNFSSKSVLKIHTRIHEGVKPFSCGICGKSFRQGSVLTLHKRVHTGETPFHCTFCNKKFAYKHHLKKHMERDHVKNEFELQ